MSHINPCEAELSKVMRFWYRVRAIGIPHQVPHSQPPRSFTPIQESYRSLPPAAPIPEPYKPWRPHSLQIKRPNPRQVFPNHTNMICSLNSGYLGDHIGHRFAYAPRHRWCRAIYRPASAQPQTTIGVGLGGLVV